MTLGKRNELAQRQQLAVPSINPLDALGKMAGLNRTYELNLNDLIVDGAVQVRVDGLDEDTVLAYVAILENGGRLDPITAIRVESGDHYVADGFHRVEAHMRAGRATIQAKVVDGSRDTALDLSEEGNLKHGRPLSNKDKKNVLLRRLGRNGHPWLLLSNSQLATELGVDPKTIGNWISTMENSIVKRTEVRGADGRVYNTSNIGQTPRTAQETPSLALPHSNGAGRQAQDDLPIGYSFASLDKGDGQASAISSDEMARRNREAVVRLAIQQVTEGIDKLLQTHSVKILADASAENRKDLIAIMIGAMVRQIQLSEQLINTLGHEDALDIRRMFRRMDSALNECAIAIEDKVREI